MANIIATPTRIKMKMIMPQKTTPISHQFRTRAEAKVVIESWRHHFNAVRPHSSLGYLTPNEFAARQTKNPAPHEATGRGAAVFGASAPRPVAPPARIGHMQQMGAVSS
jgi:Integrase core domain